MRSVAVSTAARWNSSPATIYGCFAMVNRARVQLRDPGVLREILLRPSLKFGETYMEHGWEPADGDLLRVLEVGLKFEDSLEHRMKGRRVRALLSQLLELNNPLASQHNVEHHYDLEIGRAHV